MPLPQVDIDTIIRLCTAITTATTLLTLVLLGKSLLLLGHHHCHQWSIPLLPQPVKHCLHHDCITGTATTTHIVWKLALFASNAIVDAPTAAMAIWLPPLPQPLLLPLTTTYCPLPPLTGTTTITTTTTTTTVNTLSATTVMATTAATPLPLPLAFMTATKLYMIANFDCCCLCWCRSHSI